jgi:hypothetical protein
MEIVREEMMNGGWFGSSSSDVGEIFVCSVCKLVFRSQIQLSILLNVKMSGKREARKLHMGL